MLWWERNAREGCLAQWGGAFCKVSGAVWAGDFAHARRGPFPSAVGTGSRPARECSPWTVGGSPHPHPIPPPREGGRPYGTACVSPSPSGGGSGWGCPLQINSPACAGMTTGRVGVGSGWARRLGWASSRSGRGGITLSGAYRRRPVSSKPKGQFGPVSLATPGSGRSRARRVLDPGLRRDDGGAGRGSGERLGAALRLGKLTLGPMGHHPVRRHTGEGRYPVSPRASLGR